MTKEPSGPFAQVSKLFTRIKETFVHIGEKKLDPGTTVLVFTRAAELAEDGSSKKEIYAKIDPIARVLLENVKQVKAPVLKKAGQMLEQKELENIEGSPALQTLRSERETKLREDVSKAIAGLTTLRDREFPDLNVQEAVPQKANALMRRHGEVLPSGVQDLWRGATSYKIREQTANGELRTLFDGAQVSKPTKAERSEECTKAIINALGKRMLPGEGERSRLADSLAVAILNTDGNALEWGKEWQKMGVQMGSFDALLAAMSQKLYLQSTGTLRLEYGRVSQGRDFNLIDGDKSQRKYEVTFLANGNIQIQVHLPYEMRAKPQEGEAKGQKLATFNYVNTWEFDPLMNCTGFKADVQSIQMHDDGFTNAAR